MQSLSTVYQTVGTQHSYISINDGSKIRALTRNGANERRKCLNSFGKVETLYTRLCVIDSTIYIYISRTKHVSLYFGKA